MTGDGHEPAGRERLAAIDVGSNSIRLLVAEWDPQTGLAVIDEVKEHPRLATGLAKTGRLVVSGPTTRRNTTQFIAHLEDLCRRLRRWKVIHVICDNAAFHKSRAVGRWLAARKGRVVVHYLPTRAPQENPVENVFWRLHEAVTRNHRCATIDELIESAVGWLNEEGAANPPQATFNLAA